MWEKCECPEYIWVYPVMWQLLWDVGCCEFMVILYLPGKTLLAYSNSNYRGLVTQFTVQIQGLEQIHAYLVLSEIQTHMYHLTSLGYHFLIDLSLFLSVSVSHSLIHTQLHIYIYGNTQMGCVFVYVCVLLIMCSLLDPSIWLWLDMSNFLSHSLRLFLWWALGSSTWALQLCQCAQLSNM